MNLPLLDFVDLVNVHNLVIVWGAGHKNIFTFLDDLTIFNTYRDLMHIIED